MMKKTPIQLIESAELLEDTSTLGDSIRRTLADEIFAGDFSVTQRLDEQELANRFGVSRTPVREALRQLAAAGLVELRPRRGAVLIPLDPLRIGQSFEAAAELESLAAGWAAMRSSMVEKGELSVLHDVCSQALAEHDNSQEAFATANRNFHNKILLLAKNQSLANATRMVRVETAPYQRVRFKLAEEREKSQAEHTEILKAVCTQDYEGARQAMKAHILRASLDTLKSETDWINP